MPVLLGSLARLPMGMLADRFGGRAVFAVLMVLVAVPAWLVPLAPSYRGLLGVAFFLGLAGSSFAVGVGYVSRWTPPERQGGALGVYGLGNIGQSAAVFLGPVLAAAVGWQNVFRGMAVLLVAWGVAFGLLARNAPAAARPQGARATWLRVLRERLAWVLALFYFLTFGGFVAFSIYLPTPAARPVRPDARPTPASAPPASWCSRPCCGRSAAGSPTASAARGCSPASSSACVPFALLLAWPAMVPFTVGALGCAALLGLGNGAVFKLVPQYFPGETGTVTGLVGAMGGLGGFFPPLLLGFFRDRLGVDLAGLRAARRARRSRSGGSTAASSCRGRRRSSWRCRRSSPAPPTGCAPAPGPPSGPALLVAAIVVGSRNLQNFDPALVIYTFAMIFATWGVAYHYCGLAAEAADAALLAARLAARLRGAACCAASPACCRSPGPTSSRRRSSAALASCAGGCTSCLFWGCLLAVAITFPLVFGWIHFGSAGQRPDDLRDLPLRLSRRRRSASARVCPGCSSTASTSPRCWCSAGIALALWRRMRDRGAQAVQDFAHDFFPLILLFAISVTGLALTASTLWLRGSFYGFLVHPPRHHRHRRAALSPFGKFFHIFQRPAQLGVKLYQQAGDDGRGRLLRPLRRALRLAHARRRPEAGAAASSASTTASPARPATGRSSARPASASRSPARSCD